MTTRDELRVRLAADVAPYTSSMKSAEVATRQTTMATEGLRQKALQASTVATGLSSTLASVAGSSTIAARGLTAVTVASRALAVTPAGIAMTAVGLAVGFLADQLTELKPEAEEAAGAVESFAKRVDHAAALLERQNKELADMRKRVVDLTTATNDLALGEEKSLQRRQKELERRARQQADELDRVRELTAKFSDQATQELRSGEAAAAYLETERELVVVTQRLGEIREAERERRRRDAEALKKEQDRELASLVALAQRRVGGATDAARKQEADRVAAIQRQVDALKAQVMTASERLDIEQEIADTLHEQGRVTDEEHRRRSLQIADARRELDVWYTDFDKRLADAAEHSKRQAEELRARVAQVQEVTSSLVSSGVNAIFAEWTRDLEGAQRVAAELLRTVVQIAQQALIAKIGQSALSGGTDWPRFAAGGVVHGPGTGTSDSVIARLSRGEYVVRAAAVERVGVGLLEAINNMRMPRFAGGGQVSGGGAPPQVNVALMRDDRELARFMASSEGETLVVDIMRRNGR